MTIGNVPPTEPAPPLSATSTLTHIPTPAARDRLTHEIEKPTSLWGEVKKTAIPALITGFFGYVGALIIPPTAVYDMVFRQNPNDLGGTWYGAVAGSPARLQLVDHGRLLEGTLTFRSGLPNSREIKVQGNHDSLVVLQGQWDATHDLKIGLARKIGDRHGPDDGYLMLGPEEKETAVLVCERNSIDITKPDACRAFGAGSTFFAMERGDK